MRGLLYKEFFLCRDELIFIVIFQTVISGICIAFPMIGLESHAIIVMTAVCYYLSFLILSLVNQELFTHDEKCLWSAFISSTPQTAKGQVACKYYMILIVNLFLLFCCYLTDIVVVCITGDTLVSAIVIAILIFCVRILTYAIEIPFIIRFGTNVGVAVKGLSAAFLILIVLCYGLFGDISIFFANDPITAIYQFFSSDNVIWISALIPYAAAGAYSLSYVISVRLYKEADYGE